MDDEKIQELISNINRGIRLTIEKKMVNRYKK